jgi:hypothetical protein
MPDAVQRNSMKYRAVAPHDKADARYNSVHEPPTRAAKPYLRTKSAANVRYIKKIDMRKGPVSTGPFV